MNCFVFSGLALGNNGYFELQSLLEEWRLVFWVLFFVAMFRTVIFSLWASGKVQPWDNPKRYQSPESDILTDDIESDEEIEHLSS